MYQSPECRKPKNLRRRGKEEEKPWLSACTQMNKEEGQTCTPECQPSCENPNLQHRGNTMGKTQMPILAHAVHKAGAVEASLPRDAETVSGRTMDQGLAEREDAGERRRLRICIPPRTLRRAQQPRDIDAPPESTVRGQVAYHVSGIDCAHLGRESGILGICGVASGDISPGTIWQSKIGEVR